jgi:hypothetical protein
MANPANSVIQNLLPVQAYFSVDGVFQTFIGQGQPFYATLNPIQSGLTITNSTIDSTTIGATSPSTGVFTNIATTTGTITTSPSGNTDIANKYYVDAVAQGLGPKAACAVGTTTNITLSGLQTIDSYTTVAGDRVLVKNQSSNQYNGIYIASASTWTRAVDMDVWAEVSGAYTVILNGGQANTGYVCTAAKTGTIDVTAMPWVQFSGTGTYFAGTGLTLASNTFSITNTGVTAASVGSASKTLTATVNAQGQLTALADTNIAIGATQITSGTIDTARISGSYTGITGVGTLTAGTWNASTIGVAYGGSGAATFTAGYLKASGTSAFTTVASIPNTDITGLGTMSTQNANNVAITGGTIATLTSPIAVGSGGTGASTLTGYVKGTGTAALTASATIPSTDITGLGTMSTQNANAIAVTGGSINGTTIGATTPSTGAFTTGAFTTITASTSLTTPTVQATNSGGLSLKNSAGTTQMSMGAGGGDNISLNVSTNLNGTNAQIDISPTGTGHVHIKPSGSGAIEIAPTSVGTIDNMTIGATTAKNGSFVDLSVTGTTSFDGSQGSSGQVLTSGGSGNTPTWSTPAAYATVTDDTTTNAVRYPLYAAATSGNLTTEYVASTKYQFNPSTGVLTATGFSGSGASLTSLTAGNLSGTIPSAVLGNSTVYIGTTAILLNRATASQSLTGVSIDGSAGSATTATTATNATNTAITDDTSTNAVFYPTFVSNTTGNLPQTVSSTKLKFNPSTGALTANQLIIAP